MCQVSNGAHALGHVSLRPAEHFCSCRRKRFAAFVGLCGVLGTGRLQHPCGHMTLNPCPNGTSAVHPAERISFKTFSTSFLPCLGIFDGSGMTLQPLTGDQGRVDQRHQ